MNCIMAKRRCDLAAPACLRCTQRKLECKYTGATRATSKRGLKTRNAEERRSSEPNTELSLELAAWSNPELQFEGQFDSSTTLEPALGSAPALLDSTLDVLDYNIGIHEDALNEILAAATGEPSAQLSLSPGLSWSARPRKDDDPSITLSNRLQYALDEIVKAPRAMVSENQTPWCHPQLYRDCMPRSMQGLSLLVRCPGSKIHTSLLTFDRCILMLWALRGKEPD